MAQGWFRQPVTINGEDFEGVETYEQLTTTQVRGDRGGGRGVTKGQEQVRMGGFCCMMVSARVAV